MSFISSDVINGLRSSVSCLMGRVGRRLRVFFLLPRLTFFAVVAADDDVPRELHEEGCVGVGETHCL